MMEAEHVTALLMPGGRLYFEVDIGFVVFVVICIIATIMAMTGVGYHYGRKRIAGRVARMLGNAEGQIEAKDQVIELQAKLIARQAEQIGSVRGAGKHLRAVGV